MHLFLHYYEQLIIDNKRGLEKCLSGLEKCLHCYLRIKI